MNEHERDVANTKTYAVSAVIIATIAMITFASTNIYGNYVNTTANAMYIQSYRMQEAQANANKAMFETMPRGK